MIKVIDFITKTFEKDIGFQPKCNEYLNNKVQLFEIEWYFRDYLFRANNNNKSGEFCMVFAIKDIVNTLHEKYLRFRTWTVIEIGDALLSVLPIMEKRGVLDSELPLGIVQLKSKLERKQCRECYYINYLGAEEVKECQRCGCKELVQFAHRTRP